MLCKTSHDGRNRGQIYTLRRAAYGEGSKVGLLKALVVAPDGADGAGPGLLDGQDAFRLPLQLLALQALPCSSLKPENVPAAMENSPC